MGEVVRGTDWAGRPLSRMKRLRYQRPTPGIGLIMALAIGTVAGRVRLLRGFGLAVLFRLMRS